MRTHAVPMPVSANGSTASASAISSKPTFATAGCFVLISARIAERSRAIGHAFAEQARRPEDEHGDQYEEREHVLIVAAEEREVRVARAALRDRRRPAGQLAQVREVADVTCTERLDDAEQHAAEHRARDVADAAEHRGRERLQPE